MIGPVMPWAGFMKNQIVQNAMFKAGFTGMLKPPVKGVIGILQGHYGTIAKKWAALLILSMTAFPVGGAMIRDGGGTQHPSAVAAIFMKTINLKMHATG